jgi:hypothetical protein
MCSLMSRLRSCVHWCQVFLLVKGDDEFCVCGWQLLLLFQYLH